MMRGWVPPLPLACGVLAFGLSWVALFAVAHSGTFGASFLAFGWVHLVALGWITLVALSILLHVIPAFLDVEWRSAAVARYAVLGFAVGVVLLLAGFFAGNLPSLQLGGTVTFLALLAYAGAAAEALTRAMRNDDRVTRAVGRALAGTIVFLLATALLGALFTLALDGHVSARILVSAPAAHAALGIAGWLTLLVFGVSARTMRPIAGVRSRIPALHIVSGTAVALGAIVAALGAGVAYRPAAVAGCVLLLLGTLAFAADIHDILARATVPHRPPQVMMRCATFGAVLSAIAATGASLGAPWFDATVYLALMGWIGNAVLAHMHHIGIRVLLTNARGEHDETRPQEVLLAPLSWATFALYEAAVVMGTIAALSASPVTLQISAALGFAAFLALLANAARAVRAARHRATLDLTAIQHS